MPNNFAQSYIINKYMNEVLDIESTTLDLKTNVLKHLSLVNTRVLSFSPTSGIAEHINNFKLDALSYTLDLESKIPGSSPFLDEIKDLLINCVPLSNDRDLLNSLGLPLGASLDEINRLVLLTTSFIEQYSTYLLGGILDSIISNFPFPEFEIATALATLYYNAVGYGLGGLLERLGYALEILTGCVDSPTNVLDRVNAANSNINSMLGDMFLTNSPNFNIDYTSALSGLPAPSISSIQNAAFATKVVLNNSMTSIAKSLGSPRDELQIVISNPLNVI